MDRTGCWNTWFSATKPGSMGKYHQSPAQLHQRPPRLWQARRPTYKARALRCFQEDKWQQSIRGATSLTRPTGNWRGQPLSATASLTDIPNLVSQVIDRSVGYPIPESWSRCLGQWKQLMKRRDSSAFRLCPLTFSRRAQKAENAQLEKVKDKL